MRIQNGNILKNYDVIVNELDLSKKTTLNYYNELEYIKKQYFTKINELQLQNDLLNQQQNMSNSQVHMSNQKNISVNNNSNEHNNRFQTQTDLKHEYGQGYK